MNKKTNRTMGEEVKELKAELDKKNRELEIEAALERIRSLTMVMKQSDEISEIILTVYMELRRLDLALTRTLIWLFSENPDTFEVWMADSEADEKTFVMKTEVKHPYHKRMFKQWKKRTSKWVYINKGEEKKDLDEYLFTRTEAASLPKEVKLAIRATDRIVNSFSFHNFGALHADGDEELSARNFEILNRFAKEFDLAYTRFLDLQKAEEQAREAEIELSLERVRARTMAMQRSDELKEVVALLYEQMEPLGLGQGGCEIGLCDEKTNQIQYWSSNEFQSYIGESFKIPISMHPFYEQQWEAWKQQSPHLIVTLEGEEKRQFDEITFEKTDFKNLPEDVIKSIRSTKVDVFSFVTMKYGLLEAIDNVPLPADKFPILQRFANVFEQTYTRFLDLQKAEEQAREAEIELSLERVRARTMAMHYSNELFETSTFLLEELRTLGQADIKGLLGIGLIDEESKTFKSYVSGAGGPVSKDQLVVPCDEHWLISDLYKAWKQGKKDKYATQNISRVVTKRQLKGWITKLREYSTGNHNRACVDKGMLEVAESLLQFPQWTFEDFFFDKGMIFYQNIEPLSEYSRSILTRFAKVFEQTYTRFLDLQKAEAQAREAQIETALERVRSRTMAMQKSEELSEVATVLFQQLRELGGNLWSAGFVLLDKRKEEGEFRMSNPEGEIQLPIYIPNTIDPATKNMYNHWENGDEYYSEEAGGKELKNHYDYLVSLPKAKSTFQALFDAGIKLPTWQQWHVAYFSAGYLLIITLEPYKEADLLKRFAKVFEQVYTRFLDLRKAEAQAREAQIEAALERVRAASMAMHRSEELFNTVNILYLEIAKLGFTNESTDVEICIIDESDRILETWSSDQNFSGSEIKSSTVRLDKVPVLNKQFTRWFKTETSKRKTLSLDFEAQGKEWKGFVNYMANHPDWAEAIEVFRANKIKRWFWHHAYHRYGSITIQGIAPVSQGIHEILRRFSNVFEQTYARFLDLQKAEAQAREAQIETALEKVRSRSLAMHSSEELADTASILFEQLHALGELPDRVGICIIKEEQKHFEQWVTNQEGKFLGQRFKASIEESTTMAKLYEAWKEKKDHLMIDLQGHELKKWMKFVREDIKMVVDDTNIKGRRVHNGVFFSNGMFLCTTHEPISNEIIQLLIRFAKVFEQTYTRFLDLQKAEAQAREAQIELSLERIRAQATAMKVSADLLDIVVTMRNEFIALGHDAHYFWHMRWLEDTYEKAMTSGDGTRIGMIMELPRGFHEDQRMLDWEKAKKPFGIFTYDANGAINYVEKMIHKGRFDLVDHNAPGPDDIRAMGGITFIMARTTHGEIGYSLPGVVPDPPRDDLATLVRFAVVFDLAYKRFEDLLKAEQQNRESQIELALERIRARTMAMHNSEELAETAAVLFQQLNELGVKPERINIGIVKEKERIIEWWSTAQGGKQINQLFTGSIDEPTTLSKVYTAWKKGKKSIVLEQSGKELADWLRYLREELGLPFKEELRQERRYQSTSFFTHGMILLSTPEPLSEETLSLLPRFAKVFEQTYTRFLDLQKVEAQAREAQIEAALEKVRGRAMAIRKSDELQEVLSIILEELKKFDFELYEFNIVIVEKTTNELTLWGSGIGDAKLPTSYKIKPWDHPFLTDFLSDFKSGIKYRTYELSGQSFKDYLDVLFTETDFKFTPQEYKNANYKVERVYISHAMMKHGALEAGGPQPFPDDKAEILQRFASVVDLTYTRFDDLIQAEAQAREAQIETALERVRAKAMAMHSTKDISEATTIVFNELSALGVAMERCGIVILQDESPQLEIWSTPMSSKGKKAKKIITGYLDSNFHPMVQHVFNEWKKNASYSTFSLVGDEVRDYYEKLGKVPGYKFPKIDKYPDRQMSHCFYFEHGDIFVNSQDDLPEEQKQLLHRFTKVFSLTYKRYLDLKNAEAQAREAQIEAALERVRSKTMAMHNSQDVGDTIVTLFDEVSKLEIDNDIRCGIGILEGSDRMETWSASSFPNGGVDLKMGMLDMTIHPLLKRIKKAWENGTMHYTDQMTGKNVIKYYTALNNESDYSFQRDLKTLPNKEFHNSFSFSEGILFSFSPNRMSEEAALVLNRFARVFGQTYRRYIDLLKAEEQAREAQIEAALERIRSKALAMQSSSDLHGVSMVLREQMGYLGQQELESSLIHLYNDSKTLESWYTFRSTETNSTKVVTDVAIIPVNSCDYIKETLEKYNSEENEYTIVSAGKKLHDWYNVMVKVAPDTIEYDAKGKMLVPDILYYHHSKFIGGALLMISNEKPSEEAKELQRRAAKVFNLAYQRFIDFQQAEERARESLKQASLDRVRGEIASMRSKEDLTRITPIIWKELTALGVPFIRCGVFIMDEGQQNIESHLSAPDGKSLGVLNLPYEANNVGNNAVKFWRKGKIYKDHWNKKQFVSFMKKMVKLGRLDNPELYQGAGSPPESLDLHFVPFKQGMLYVGNTEPLNEEGIKLVKSLAEAFSIAYARYEDFTQLEQAKNQIEQALGELKSTQTQLIHAEKMASLGELTAGIAHEIQNPLNFVNNFSEVSKELIEEMKEEMDAGNHEDVKEISEDVIQNLDKINHHGQRASSIVKGMLEHSRTGKQEKELTDLNVLADEYLRLSYHGLRAKDKSFNADFKTEFDGQLPKYKVISQDIGRVLLNLINNAFYAVSKRSQENGDGYKPTVLVSTKKHDKFIEIVVQDNGGGIPNDVVDKIFQPFFTTKPTGQGTGLGLSLSYDIITKGHDGHLEVETEEGVGSKFVIQLPLD